MIDINDTLNTLNQNIARIASELKQVRKIGSCSNEDSTLTDDVSEVINNIESLKESAWNYSG